MDEARKRAAMGPLPEIAIPSSLGLRAGSSLRSGAESWRNQARLTPGTSNVPMAPAPTLGVGSLALSGGMGMGMGSGTATGMGSGVGSGMGTGMGVGAVSTSSLFQGQPLAPLFRRVGSTNGMTLDPAANAVAGTSRWWEWSRKNRPTKAWASSSRASWRAGSTCARSPTVSSSRQAVRDRFQDALLEYSLSNDDGRRTLGGRGAAFGSGEIGGGYQLTVRIDTEKDESRRFFEGIRPEDTYDVFGDASSTLYEAQSRGRLFASLARGDSYLMYGDYNTSTYDAARLLGRYTRTLNGALYQYGSDRLSLRSFASRDSFRRVVDELPALGISGPYALSRADGLLNSEQVEIVTRDRNQPALILTVEPMQRFTDYTIEPFTGRLVFRRPVPSVDDRLNPVSIRVMLLYFFRSKS